MADRRPDSAAEQRSEDEGRPGGTHEPDRAEGAPEAPEDVAEKPGAASVPHEHADDLADEWSEDSFPASDPPAHY